MKRAKMSVPAALACVAAIAACASKPYDDAQGFVDAANAEGAGFELGPVLSSSDPDHEIRAIELHGGGGLAEEANEPGQAHLGGGSVTITPSEDEARSEYAECESAVSLLCYRAGNAALVLEGEITPDQRARIDAAISALASD